MPKMPMVTIEPRAANAFDLRIYDRSGNLSYVLECHTDGENLMILPRDADGKAIRLEAVAGYSAEEQQRMKFHVLTIKPVEKEISSK